MRLKILQWNIWYKEDISNIADFVLSIKPDIFCAQELTIGYEGQSVSNTIDYIETKLDMHYALSEMPLESFTLCNAIFSKYEIIEENYAIINSPTGTENYEDELRTLVLAKLKLSEAKTLSVATTHMSYTDKFKVTDRKMREIHALFDATKTYNDAFILTGDFNATPESEVIKLIQTKLKNLGPNSSEKSWTTKPFSYQGFEANTLDWRLDYVFGTQDIKVISAEILNTPFSDHLPILLEVEI